jgi:hypothetical protein
MTAGHKSQHTVPAPPAGSAWLQPIQHLYKEAVGLGSGAEQAEWHHHSGGQSAASLLTSKSQLQQCSKQYGHI